MFKRDLVILCMSRVTVGQRRSLTPAHGAAGLSRLELRAKGDTNELYANLVVVILALGAVWLPLMHYLVDRKGYAVTLFVINTLGVVCSGLQARSMSFTARSSQGLLIRGASWPAFRAWLSAQCPTSYDASTSKTHASDPCVLHCRQCRTCRCRS